MSSAILYFYRNPSTAQTDLVYKIGDKYYDTYNLSPIESSTVVSPNPYISFGPDDLSIFTSHPVVLGTNGGVFLITTGTQGRLVPIYTIIGNDTNPYPTITSKRPILLPNLKAGVIGKSQNYPGYSIPSFNNSVYQMLNPGVNVATAPIKGSFVEGGPPKLPNRQFTNTPLGQPIYLSQIRTGKQPEITSSPKPTLRPTPVPVQPIPLEATRSQEVINMTVDALIKQLYGGVVELPLQIGPMKVISFEEVSKLIQSGQIQNYYLDVFMQPWAGPPGNLNSMITFVDRSGSIYLAKVRYNKAENSINPPS